MREKAVGRWRWCGPGRSAGLRRMWLRSVSVLCGEVVRERCGVVRAGMWRGCAGVVGSRAVRNRGLWLWCA